jgi:pimeloyl-ACP methyl ester carboxylesterase
MTSAEPSCVSRFVTAPDGLRLHMRDYGDRMSALTPVVCLPGLTRPAGDFHALALELANQGRRVLAIDYRGRGLSDWDKDWTRYDIYVESADIQAMLIAAGIARAIIVGTSRGGLHAMALSAMKPILIKAAVLNDIGPIIENAGLVRIRGYVGKLPQPASYPQAVDMLKHLFGGQFTNVAEEDWETYARLTFPETDGKLTPCYDPALLKTLESLDLEAPLPVLWPQFDGLRDVPVMAIRGGNSDLLSVATHEAMVARRPGCEALTVPGQGHAPLLLDAPTIGAIARFVAEADRA